MKYSGKDFYKKVFELVKTIPAGKVTTYGAIAECLGSKSSARMVGWALNSTKGKDANVPAHRVVNRNGMLTGKNHFDGINMMEELLVSEGVKVEKNKIVNFSDFLWIPCSNK